MGHPRTGRERVDNIIDLVDSTSMRSMAIGANKKRGPFHIPKRKLPTAGQKSTPYIPKSKIKVFPTSTVQIYIGEKFSFDTVRNSNVIIRMLK